MKTRRFFYYGKFVVLGIAGLILFTFVVMWLWNWLVPDLFKGPELNYWQTLGILVLSKILFTGMNKGHQASHPGHPRYPGREHDYSHKFHEKWRQKFEEKMNGWAEEGKGEGGDRQGEEGAGATATP